MFKKGFYNVKKASKKNKNDEEKKKIELKKKQEMNNLNVRQSPEYYKKSHPKKVTTKKWVENSTFIKKK